MRQVYIACLISILMFAQGASAQSVVYDVRPAGGAGAAASQDPVAPVDDSAHGRVGEGPAARAPGLGKRKSHRDLGAHPSPSPPLTSVSKNAV